jgi:hypothetical protein
LAARLGVGHDVVGDLNVIAGRQPRQRHGPGSGRIAGRRRRCDPGEPTRRGRRLTVCRNGRRRRRRSISVAVDREELDRVGRAGRQSCYCGGRPVDGHPCAARNGAAWVTHEYEISRRRVHVVASRRPADLERVSVLLEDLESRRHSWRRDVGENGHGNGERRAVPCRVPRADSEGVGVIGCKSVHCELCAADGRDSVATTEDLICGHGDVVLG